MLLPSYFWGTIFLEIILICVPCDGETRFHSGAVWVLSVECWVLGIVIVPEFHSSGSVSASVEGWVHEIRRRWSALLASSASVLCQHLTYSKSHLLLPNPSSSSFVFTSIVDNIHYRSTGYLNSEGHCLHSLSFGKRFSQNLADIHSLRGAKFIRSIPLNVVSV